MCFSYKKKKPLTNKLRTDENLYLTDGTSPIWERTKDKKKISVFMGIRKKARMNTHLHTFTTSQHCTGSASQGNLVRQRNKSMQTRKKDLKKKSYLQEAWLSLWRIYKTATKTGELSNVAEYKVNDWLS